MSRGFESSASGPLKADAVVECGVCWWVYDPAKGDESADIPPGVAFADLPDDWRCPCCDNAKSKFMIRDLDGVAGSASASGPLPLDERVDALVIAYQTAEKAMMGLPVHNPKLDIEAVGFQPWLDGYAGIIVTPWCMNLVYLHADPAADPPGAIGSSRSIAFPSGGYSFIAGRMDGVGMVETCSLFSPMDEFEDHGVAVEAARSASQGLFEVEEPPEPKPVSRRFLFTYKGKPQPA